jgi:peroxiredoxin
MSRLFILRLGLVLALCGLLVGGYFLIQKKAPAPAVQWSQLDGKVGSLAAWKGRVVLVNFWATSCVTCVREMPNLVKTYEKFHDKGLEMVAVAMSYDRPDYVMNYVHSNRLPFQVGLDVDGKIAKAFGDVSLTPTTFLIDRQGNIVKKYIGEPDFEKLHVLLEGM